MLCLWSLIIMFHCNSSIGAPRFVTYLHDAPILVVAITLPLYRPLVPYLDVMLPAYKSLSISCSVLVTEKHAIPARSINLISFWFIHHHLHRVWNIIAYVFGADHS
jgi:hypothetical protein